MTNDQLDAEIAVSLKPKPPGIAPSVLVAVTLLNLVVSGVTCSKSSEALHARDAAEGIEYNAVQHAVIAAEAVQVLAPSAPMSQRAQSILREMGQ